MGRSRSRRRRGKSGGQGSGGSGKGKGTGGSRGRSSGTRGGAGKGGSGSGKGTGGSRGRSNNTRGGQAKANRNQNKKARRTVRSVKKAVSKVAKGIGKSLRGAAANAASVTGKPKSKLQQQLSNLRKDIAQKSTKEARFQRRADRLKRQFGLDTGDMRNLKLNLNLDTVLRQKFKIPGTNIKIGVNDRIRKSLPKSIRNFRRNWDLGGKFRSPHKLGVREGYRAPNRGGQTIAANTRQQLAGLRADPSQDIGMMYQNILGRESDQEGLDYWTNEFRSGRQSMDDIRRQLVRSDEFQGRSDADKSSALRGLKQRRAARGEKVGVSRMIEEMDKRGIRHSKTGSPPRRFPDTKVALPFFPPGSQPGYGGDAPKVGLPYFPDGAPREEAGFGRYTPRSDGPQQDWLGSLYSRHNISGGKLDQKARDYWSNEAKTRGRDAVMDSIIGTSKAEGTYGGRKRPRRINTGSGRRGGGSIWGLGAALAGRSVLRGHRDRKGARRKAQAANRRNAASLAASVAAIRGGLG